MLDVVRGRGDRTREQAGECQECRQDDCDGSSCHVAFPLSRADPRHARSGDPPPPAAGIRTAENGRTRAQSSCTWIVAPWTRSCRRPVGGSCPTPAAVAPPRSPTSPGVPAYRCERVTACGAKTLAGLHAEQPTVVAGIQSLGMLLGPLVALHLGAGFVAIHKYAHAGEDDGEPLWRRSLTREGRSSSPLGRQRRAARPVAFRLEARLPGADHGGAGPATGSSGSDHPVASAGLPEDRQRRDGVMTDHRDDRTPDSARAVGAARIRLGRPA